jgi:hypothetical protein
MEMKIKQDITTENLKPLVEINLLEDGHLCPLLFICNREGATVSNISSYMEDNDTKDELIDWLVKTVKTEQAHRIVIVSECWMYLPPEKMPEDQIEALIKMGRVRDFDKKDAYQIINFTRDTTAVYTRLFTREEDNVILGEELTGKFTLERFATVQENLTEIN